MPIFRLRQIAGRFSWPWTGLQHWLSGRLTVTVGRPDGDRPNEAANGQFSPGIIRRPSPGDLPMAVRAPGDLRAMSTNRSIAVRSPSGDRYNRQMIERSPSGDRAAPRRRPFGRHNRDFPTVALGSPCGDRQAAARRLNDEWIVGTSADHPANFNCELKSNGRRRMSAGWALQECLFGRPPPDFCRIRALDHRIVIRRSILPYCDVAITSVSHMNMHTNVNPPAVTYVMLTTESGRLCCITPSNNATDMCINKSTQNSPQSTWSNCIPNTLPAMFKAASQALEIVRWLPDFPPFVAGCLFFDIGRSPSDSPDLEQLWELAQRPPDGHRRTSGRWSAERSCQRPVFLGIIRRPSPGDLPMAVRAPGDLRAMSTNRSIAVRSPSGDLAATGRWSHNHRPILTPLPQIWAHV